MTLAPYQFPRGRIQSQALTRSSSHRGNGRCAQDSHQHHAVDTLVSSVTPPPLRRLDHTEHHFAPALDADRPFQEQVRVVAENALLRQQLIILRRQVKRPACTRTDRMLLVLLARKVRTWKQALFIVQEDDTAALASPGLQALVETHVQDSLYHTQDIPRDRSLEEARWQGTIACGEQNVSRANCSNWASASASAPFRSI
jgi:hypothetical protein